jgi:hypothetical protein
MLATIERSGHAARELRVEASGLARNADLQMRVSSSVVQSEVAAEAPSSFSLVE